MLEKKDVTISSLQFGVACRRVFINKSVGLSDTTVVIYRHTTIIMVCSNCGVYGFGMH